MTEPLSDRVERLETVASEAADAARERDALSSEIGEGLAGHVEEAVADAGTNVEAVDRSGDGRFRFEARLDRAAMVAALIDALPAGFVISHVNDDGSLSVEWTGSERTPGTRDRAVELGLERDAAVKRLDRLVSLDMIDVADSEVYPDTNFSRI